MPLLQNLINSVGKAAAPALLVQLRADLTAAAETIRTATPRKDWLALRRASHNLTALAGTAGGTALQSLADRMNHAAHAEALQLNAVIQDEAVALDQRILALLTDFRP